ncbi:MAG: hypothetical protein E7333_04865 [Clostridiales bacterium]|nr:hypothetical protein [Clostridiales bacterium]
MRKITLLIFALLLCLMAVSAAQALDTPYDPATVCHTLSLTDRQMALVEYLYPRVTAGEEDITLPEGTAFDDVSPALRALGLDFPELIHLGSQWTTHYYRSAPDVAVSVTVQYRMNQQAYHRALTDMMNIARAMAAPGENQVETAELLHDRLCERVSYARGEGDHTAYEALVTGRAACEGYSKALALLYRLAGIPCGVVTGEAVDESENVEGHAWNVAKVAGAWMLLDATWNDQDKENLNTHWYYGLSDEQMARDHTPVADSALPLCPECSINWHERRGLIVRTEKDLFRALKALVRQQQPVSLRFADADEYTRFTLDLSGALTRYNDQAVPGDEFYGRLSVLSSPRQHTVMLRWYPQ